MTAKRKLMTVNDVKGAWAIMPTPAKPNASDWRNENTVDIDEAVRVAESLVASGVDAIMSLGTFGECATLTWDEKYQFMAAVSETIGGRVPFFCGTTSLNTRETIRQTRAAADLGIDGTMLGLPMWCAMDLPSAVQFYRDVAEACPNTAICIYANNEAFKFDFPRPFWAMVSQIPQVIAAKYIGVGFLDIDIQLSQERIRLLPIDMDYYAAARINPEFCTAFWTGGAVCGPAPSIALRDSVIEAKRTGDWEKAHDISKAIGFSLSAMIPKGGFKEFSTYNIGLEKERMNAAGWMKAGPMRPPYHLVPETYLEGARESGRRWAALHQQFSAK